MKFNFRVVGLEICRARYKTRSSALNSMSAFWRRIGDWFIDRTIKERFDKERAPDGTPWAPWSEGYRERMAKKGKGGNKILADRGELRNSLHRETKRDSVVVGTVKEYAATHQFGDHGRDKRGRRRNIPARTFLGINETDKEEIRKKVARYIKTCGSRGMKEQ